jgi:hypothetical protein
MLRAVWAALGVVGLLAAVAWRVMRRAPDGFAFRWRRPEQGAPIQSLARLPLTPHHVLHIVEWQGHQWLAGTSPQGLTIQPIPVPGRFDAEFAGAFREQAGRAGEVQL